MRDILNPAEELVLAVAMMLDPSMFERGSELQLGHVPKRQEHAKKRARRLIRFILRYTEEGK